MDEVIVSHERNYKHFKKNGSTPNASTLVKLKEIYTDGAVIQI